MRHTITGIRSQCPDHINQVSDHCGSGRFCTCARPIVQGMADGIPVDHNSIHDSIDTGHQSTRGQQTRMDSKLYTLFGSSGNPEMFDTITEFLGIQHIICSDITDPFYISLLEIQGNSKGYRSQNGQFMGGINTIDIKTRIGFSVAQLLRQLQFIGKFTVIFTHSSQDKVGRTIDNASQPVDSIRSKPFTQNFYNGDASADGGFKSHGHPLLVSSTKDLIPMERDQRFVCCDDMLAVGDRLQDKLTRWFLASHQFDHDINVRVSNNINRVTGYPNPLYWTVTNFAAMPDRSGTDDNPSPGPATDFINIPLQYIDRAAADCAKSYNSCSNRIHNNSRKSSNLAWLLCLQ